MWHLMLAAVLFGLANARLSDDKCKEYHEKSLGNKVNSTLNEQFPHMGLLGYANEDNGFRYGCPATLISESFVISPAHCLLTSLGDPKHVLIGTLSLKNLDKNHKILDVVETITHPDSKHTLQENSLALIKFSPPLTSDDSIKPGCLYTKNIADNQELTDLLWAQPEEEPRGLFKVESSIVPVSTCEKHFKEKLSLDEKSHLCLFRKYPKKYAFHMGGTSHVYEGDVPKIVAIDNFGASIPSVDHPDVSTKLGNYLDWIEKNVWK